MLSSRIRLLIYDASDHGAPWRPGLRHAWRSGGVLYRGLGRIDEAFGARHWSEALGWVATFPESAVEEIQIWSHGNWGRVMLGQDVLDVSSLLPTHPLNAPLRRMRERLVSRTGLLWFRTCETFGSEAGHRFSGELTSWLGCRTAGHSHVIGVLQSGLHSLSPGAQPTWSTEEGVRRVRGAPVALPSRPDAPNTITCFESSIPDGW